MIVTTRLATPDDTRAIATIRVRTWQQAYAGLITQEALDRMDIEREARLRLERWGEFHADPRGGELLAEVDGEAAGWALFGSSIDADRPDDGQLFAIYALPRFWSAGVGHALLDEVEARLREAGFTRAHLWVLEGNERAASFYERHVWYEDGVWQDDDQLIRGEHAQTLRERRRVKDLATA
jgi:GNAT superfamily N-acetyltransferase